MKNGGGLGKFIKHICRQMRCTKICLIRLTQCCTQFKSPGVKILCVLYLHYNVELTSFFAR